MGATAHLPSPPGTVSFSASDQEPPMLASTSPSAPVTAPTPPPGTRPRPRTRGWCRSRNRCRRAARRRSGPRTPPPAWRRHRSYPRSTPRPQDGTRGSGLHHPGDGVRAVGRVEADQVLAGLGDDPRGLVELLPGGRRIEPEFILEDLTVVERRHRAGVLGNAPDR